MPNGEQVLEQGQEGEDSAEESGDWESSDDEDEEESDESDDEEAVDSPPRSEHRSKQHHDPAGGRGKAAPQSMQDPKRIRKSTPEPLEKSAEHPKVAPLMPRNARPKIKVAGVHGLLHSLCNSLQCHPTLSTIKLGLLPRGSLLCMELFLKIM